MNLDAKNENTSCFTYKVEMIIQILAADEITARANLDEKGTQWYHELVKQFADTKTIVVCSNSPFVDAQFCTQSLNIEDYIIRK